MECSLLELLPDRCLEIVFDKLNVRDFENFMNCCKRTNTVGKDVRKLKLLRLHDALRQNAVVKWRLLHGGEKSDKAELTPGKRFGSTMVFFDNSIYLFGGATVNWTTFNDLWRFDLTDKKWCRRNSKGTSPTPRASACGIINGDKLIIIGGFQLQFSIHAKNICDWDNLPWIYDFTNNDWRLMLVDNSKIKSTCNTDSSDNFNITPTPVGQSACRMGSDCIVLFGGAKTLLNHSQGYHRGTVINPYLLSDQAYLLSISTGIVTLISPSCGICPPKRCGHTSATIDDKRIMILGGYLGPNMKNNEDMWMLTNVTMYDKRCDCAVTDSNYYFWVKIALGTWLQPMSTFFNNAILVPAISGSSCSLVILGGASDDVCNVLFPPLDDRHYPVSQREQLKRKLLSYKKTSPLVIHSVDLGPLPSCISCGTCCPNDDIDSRQLEWIPPTLFAQDLSNAPFVRQGFSIASGNGSLFIYGGLVYQSVYSRPVYLINDLMLRDSDANDLSMQSCCDLHQLTYDDRSMIV